ncbi:hypothetical protein EXIGLDRAFT_721830 [Exidia glandulosa HHB12029]|uniref:Uncharacterized protein n=1 Tax=Exidia glandulosa HHB12029 TaxID=1314781 RepID=A0A165QI65_EXIGL|nr:hypothetical protein EXIGLDRAFT_721830 [Exidia glandulosa HHB12029]
MPSGHSWWDRSYARQCSIASVVVVMVVVCSTSSAIPAASKKASSSAVTSSARKTSAPTAISSSSIKTAVSHDVYKSPRVCEVRKVKLNIIAIAGYIGWSSGA